MANSKITWANKESLVTDPTIAEKNKVTDSNMNEIKSVVNENADQIIVSDTEPTSNENEIWLDTSDTIPYVNSEILNNYGNAQNLGYSQNYQNEHNVIVSSTEPTTSERVWFKQGKNLFDGLSNGQVGYYLDSSGVETSGGENLRISNYIRINASEGSVTVSGMENTMNAPSICFYDKTKTFISGVNYGGLATKTITIPSTAYYFRTSFRTTNPNTMIEYGTIASTYTPYEAPSINVDNEEIYNKPVTIVTRQVVTYADQIGSAVFTIDYPTGFNADNTIVLSLGYKYASDNQWKFGSIAGSDVNINPFFVTLNYNNENKIRVRFDDVEAEVNYNADFKIVLMRM